MEDGGACSQLRSLAHCSLEDVLAVSRIAVGADLGKVYNGTGSGAVRTPGDSWGAADGNFGYKRFSETQLRAT